MKDYQLYPIKGKKPETKKKDNWRAPCKKPTGARRSQADAKMTFNQVVSFYRKKQLAFFISPIVYAYLYNNYICN